MSALEIIEQIKALPPKERDAVVAFVENLQIPGRPSPGRAANGEGFADAAHHVFENYGSLLERLAK